MIAIDTLCQAMAERRVIRVTYKSVERTAEPYILGYDDSSQLTLSAFQTAGGSGVGFRTYRVRELSGLKVTDLKFLRDRPEYNPRDRFFARITCQV